MQVHVCVPTLWRSESDLIFPKLPFSFYTEVGTLFELNALTNLASSTRSASHACWDYKRLPSPFSFWVGLGSELQAWPLCSRQSLAEPPSPLLHKHGLQITRTAWLKTEDFEHLSFPISDLSVQLLQTDTRCSPYIQGSTSTIRKGCSLWALELNLTRMFYLLLNFLQPGIYYPNSWEII